MRRSPLPALLLPLACAAALSVPSPAAAASTCDRVAATTGSDSAAGTAAAPYRTATMLVGSLAPGQVGCLRGGVYPESVSISRDHVTLTSFPGERATLLGRLWVKRGGDGVVLAGLSLDGENASSLPSPTINGDDVQLLGNDITNDHTSICVSIGSTTWGRAQRTILRGNRIHDCGRRPSTNYDHGIYVAAADDTQILDNVIYGNTDRGVQLYPDAQRTVVRGNIIDGNGEGVLFSGAGGSASSGSMVEGNVISNATIRTNVESWYPTGNPSGSANVVRANCVWNGARGSIAAQTGFVATDNRTADPGFVGRSAGDFRLSQGSPCATVMAASLAPAGPNGERPVTGGNAGSQAPQPGAGAAPPKPAPVPASGSGSAGRPGPSPVGVKRATPRKPRAHARSAKVRRCSTRRASRSRGQACHRRLARARCRSTRQAHRATQAGCRSSRHGRRAHHRARG